MNANLDQIDLLRERTGASYQDAKEALEKNNFDIVESIVYLEKQGKSKTYSSASDNQCAKECGIGTAIKKIIKKCNNTQFIIEKNGVTTLNIPVTLAIILGFIFTPATIVVLAVALLTNHRIKIKGEQGEDLKVNSVLNKVSDSVNDAKEKFTEQMKKETV
jgi:NACalpha-BTF3-like transcription factor